MNKIQDDLKALFKIMPKAKITPTITKKHIKYECDLRRKNISEKEHDSYFDPIKRFFKDRLIERYSHETGHFDVLVKH